MTIDAQKDLITVKGTMDAKELPNYLKEKLKRSVEVVPPAGGKKDDKKDGKKDEKKDEKKDKDGGGGEKKDKGGGGGDGDKGKEKGGDGPKAEVSKMEYMGYPYYPSMPVMVGHGGGFGSVGGGFVVPGGGGGGGFVVPGVGGQGGNVMEYVHAPQMFSDENPNACSVM